MWDYLETKRALPISIPDVDKYYARGLTKIQKSAKHDLRKVIDFKVVLQFVSLIDYYNVQKIASNNTKIRPISSKKIKLRLLTQHC